MYFAWFAIVRIRTEGLLQPSRNVACFLLGNSPAYEFYMHIGIYEGKSVPLQACSGPEVSRKLRLPDYVKTAKDGGQVVSLTHRPPLPPRNTHGTHFC